MHRRISAVAVIAHQMALAAPRRRFLRTDRPICPVHDKPMNQYSRAGEVLYFRCTDDGCRETGKSIRRVV